MFHLHGNILTEYGIASNNHGRNEGNMITLPILHWRGGKYSTVSAEAIREALRFIWQEQGLSVNRTVHPEDPENRYHYKPEFDPNLYVDDDIMGYLKIEQAKQEASPDENAAQVEQPPQEPDENTTQVEQPTQEPDKKKKPKKPKKPPKGKGTPRKGALDVTRAISTTPYDSDVVHNASGGKKDSTSLYSSQCHSTYYQYGFSITPNHLTDCKRVFHVLDGLDSLHRVGGSHSRWLYDFSPNSLIFRWTHDPCPRFLYCVEANNKTIDCPKLLKRMKNGRIDPEEVWIAGDIVEYLDVEILKSDGVHIFENPAFAIADLKQQMRRDLEIESA